MVRTLLTKLNDLLDMYNEGVVLVILIAFAVYLTTRLCKVYFIRTKFKNKNHLKEIETFKNSYEREISILQDLHKSKVIHIHKDHKKVLRKLAIQIECTIEDHEREIL